MTLGLAMVHKSLLSAPVQEGYKPAPHRGDGPANGKTGVRNAFGQDQRVSAVREGAFHERKAARLFPCQAPGLKEAKETLQHLQDENQNHPDLADRASSETDRAIELRARDRQRKLIAKIDAALQRIDEGTYGYCEETGEPISLKRLEARPIATLSVEAQERHERRERVYRDD
jgi:DnaK suppressor protein